MYQKIFFCVLTCNLLYRSSVVCKSRHWSSCPQLDRIVFLRSFVAVLFSHQYFVMLSTIALTKRHKVFYLYFIYLLMLGQVHKCVWQKKKKRGPRMGCSSLAELPSCRSPSRVCLSARRFVICLKKLSYSETECSRESVVDRVL